MYTSYTVYNELYLCTLSRGMSLPQTSAHLMKFYDSGSRGGGAVVRAFAPQAEGWVFVSQL